jgi:hypothetical protein
MAAAFTADDASEALPKGTDGQKAAWLKMANRALNKGATREEASSGATKMVGNMKEARATLTKLREVGRVLSAANEKQLRSAQAAIEAVLKALDAGDEPAPADVAAAEAYSQEANDAAKGVGIVTSMQFTAQSLLYLLSDEADEPDQVAMIQKAYDAQMAVVPLVLTWITAEMGEIGGPDDQNMYPGALCVCGHPFDCDCTGCDCPAHTNSVFESAPPLVGDVVALLESAISADGTMPVKLIQPGWGSSGYYSADVLKRDGPSVFKAGTHMFVDHPGFSEEADRPERSIRDIGGVLATDAWWDPNGAKGPGLYAKAKPVEAFRPLLDELAPNIGVSIRAHGTAKSGEAEGKRGPIIEKLLADAMTSADFVTVAGAGGQIVLAEAWRKVREDALPKLTGPIEDYADPVNHVGGPIKTPKDIHDCSAGLGRYGGDHARIQANIIRIAYRKGSEFVAALPDAWKKPEDQKNAESAAGRRTSPTDGGLDMDQQELLAKLAAAEKERDTALSEAARANEALMLREARDVTAAELSTAQVPDVTRTRLTESLSKNPPVKDGKFDADAQKARIKEAVAAEVDYLSKVTGAGQVRNLGGTPTPEDPTKSLAESFKAMGLSDKTAAIAAAGRI